MTRDSDIVIQLYGNQIDSFVKLFEQDFYTDKNMIEDPLNNKMMFNIFDKNTFFKIDFIFKNNEDYENVKFERKSNLKINGLEVYVISIEDLIISKLIGAKNSHSEMHLKDIRELMKIDYDKMYLNEWIIRLGLNEIFSKL